VKAAFGDEPLTVEATAKESDASKKETKALLAAAEPALPAAQDVDFSTEVSNSSSSNRQLWHGNYCVKQLLRGGDQEGGKGGSIVMVMVMGVSCKVAGRQAGWGETDGQHGQCERVASAQCVAARIETGRRVALL
jgi:hypothetical protein